MQRQKVFGERGDGGEVKGGGRSVADSNDRGGEEGNGGNEIVVWGWWVGRRAKGTDVDDGPLKFASAAIFNHLIGRIREDARDGAWATPGNDVVGFPSGAYDLRVRGGNIDFNACVQGKSGGSAMFI